MNMEELVNELVLTDRREDLADAHDELVVATEELVYTVLENAVSSADEFHYLDDGIIHTIDRDESEPKEIMSGDAALRIAEDDEFGETINEYEVQYAIYCGIDGSAGGEEVYDPVEVIVTKK